MSWASWSLALGIVGSDGLDPEVLKGRDGEAPFLEVVEVPVLSRAVVQFDPNEAVYRFAGQADVRPNAVQGNDSFHAVGFVPGFLGLEQERLEGIEVGKAGQEAGLKADQVVGKPQGGFGAGQRGPAARARGTRWSRR